MGLFGNVLSHKVTGSSKWLKLEDGGQVLVVPASQAHGPFDKHFPEGQFGPATTRTMFAINMWDIERKQMLIYEASPKRMSEIGEVMEEGGQAVYKLKRRGTGKTTQHIAIKVRELTDVERAEIAAAPLHKLGVNENDPDALPF